ncbi:glutathione S-transferase family protein [Aquabacter sp. L1I39]|uniref:glutathione S-transferase family protein n=1 Tax=Aquabacter sp. L1I39 TaxID=2820278 RepID=UPI001ADD0A01|nr:glutathione S-transferase family protein [Aquabacter sp. L1I39]QTL02592.1 glutathione S-transferase family protein [Aquabacter sp. L1I39]
MTLALIIANKNYSSWSMRPWLALKAADVDFEEKLVPLGSDLFRKTLAGLGTAGRVPVLLDDGAAIWESLAIIEHVAELYPDRPFWPTDRAARAMARAVAAEMHAGFHYLRRHLPMNLWRPPEPRALDEGGEKDLARLTAIWTAARARFGAEGPFLFGRFSAADAMFAPLATRLRTYQVPMTPEVADYVAAIHAYPHFVAWRDAALAEPWEVAEDEVDWPIVKREAAPQGTTGA